MKEKLNVNQIPELKQAILDLPEKERSQLLIRLINKDQVLIEQLHFRLLENEYDLIQRFEDLKSEISSALQAHVSVVNKATMYTRGKLVLSIIRQLSGRINHFAKVTKDVNFELQLRAFLLLESSRLFINIQNEETVFGLKTRVYQVTKIKTMLNLFKKLHEDLQYDFSITYFDAIEHVVIHSLRTELLAAKLDYRQFKVH